MTEPASRTRSAGLIFIFVTVLLDVIGIGLIIPIMPQLVAQFVQGDIGHASRYYGALTSVYTLMQFLLAPTLGGLSDRFGRKPVLLLSLFAAGCSYMITGLAPSLIWLFLARVVGGAAGGSITVATTYIADVSPPEKRAANFGIIGAAFGLGFIIGPATGGLLGAYGLRLPLFVAAAVSFLNLLFGLFIVPESLPAEKRHPFDWSKANPIGGLLNLRRYPSVAGLALTIFLAGMAQNGLQTTWVLYTAARFSWTVRETGLSLAVVGLCAAVVQGGLIRRLIPRIGERRAALTGQTINVAAFTLYGYAWQGWMMYAIIPLHSIAGMSGPAIQGLIAHQVPSHEQGRVQGALTSIMSLSGILAPLEANWLFAHFNSSQAQTRIPGASFYVGAMLLAMALANTWRLLRSGQVQEAVVRPAP